MPVSPGSRTQRPLFGVDDDEHDRTDASVDTDPSAAPPRRGAAAGIPPASIPPDLAALARALHDRFGDRLYLGTSSWSFPGWQGLVWAAGTTPSDAVLSRQGLRAYAAHPLLRTVSLDRTFYRAIDAAAYGRLAGQVPDAFRFVVKAPAEITDAVLRDPETGAPQGPNPGFLDPQRALDAFVQPALAGLGRKLAVLVFQVPPLPAVWRQDPGSFIDRLTALWHAVVPALPDGTVAALELRDADLLAPAMLDRLALSGVRYCLGLHDRMPPAEAQARAAERAGSGDFVCRWSLHAGLKYRQAKARWEPFDRLQAPDADTREALARAVIAALVEGYRAFVTINNKAEGSAPLSVVALAEEILRQARAGDA